MGEGVKDKYTFIPVVVHIHTYTYTRTHNEYIYGCMLYYGRAFLFGVGDAELEALTKWVTCDFKKK